jgi:hypothetical protein
LITNDCSFFSCTDLYVQVLSASTRTILDA